MLKLVPTLIGLEPATEISVHNRLEGAHFLENSKEV
jgi:hypothetical protein